MDKEQVLIKADLLKKAIEALPDSAVILNVTIDYDPKYDQILLYGSGGVPEIETVETKVENGGATIKIAAISGFFVKWYPKEGDE